MPDNYTPDRSEGSPHRMESIDEALARPEIAVVASHPETVLPMAMSEVVGNEGVDFDVSLCYAPLFNFQV